MWTPSNRTVPLSGWVTMLLMVEAGSAFGGAPVIGVQVPVALTSALLNASSRR